MLIATLPSLMSEELLEEVFASQYVGAVRYNTGERSPFSPLKTLRILHKLALKYRKRLWIDLKGRQLRITRWGAPRYGRIVLNHKIFVEGEPLVYFRGEDKPSRLKLVRGNTIYVDPPPRYAVGEGQSVNIISDSLHVSGYLTSKDIAYIRCAKRLGLRCFNLSFFESWDDIDSVRRCFFGNGQQDPYRLRVGLKVETPKGFESILSASGEELAGLTLIVGRDDLYRQIGPDKTRIIEILEGVIRKDPDAVVGSKIFSGLEFKGEIQMSDISDLTLLWRMGYRNFLLSDEICQRHFHKAIEGWRMFTERFPDNWR